MRKIFIIATALACTLAATAATVTCTPGRLSSLVSNTGTTTLTVNGSLDARDFQFIVEQLTALKTLNLQNATIAAYDSMEPIYGIQQNYAAGEVPLMALAGHRQLTTVTLPTNATGIGRGAFADCQQLTSVTMGARLIEIGSYAFAGCTALTTVSLPASVAKIGDGAFRRCTALNTVSTRTGNAAALAVGEEAFLGCSALTHVTLSNMLISIGARAFSGTTIKNFDLSAYHQLRSVGDYAFVMSQAGTVRFPNSVTTLGRGAFLYTDVNTVNIPDELQRVAPYTFAGAQQLEYANLSATHIDSIGDYAFYQASNIKVLTLPSSVEHLGTKAMAYTTALDELRSQTTTVPTLGDDVWQGITQPNVKLYVKNDLVNQYKGAAQWKNFNVLTGYLRGDANIDNVIDIGDVNAIINHLLNKPSTEPFSPDFADTDENGKIDIDDVNYIINVITRHIDPSLTPIVADTDDVVGLDDFTIDAGSTCTVPLKISAPSAYTAMQCDIVLPEGLTLVGNGFSPAVSSDHLMTCSQVDGVLRVLCYSLSGSEIGTDTDNAVATITVAADASLSADAVVLVKNAVLGTASSAVHHCEPTTANVGSTTAVRDMNDGHAATSRAWAEQGTIIIESNNATQAQLVAMNGVSTTLAVLDGRNEYNGIEPGVYVVRLDGKSYKVVVK